jgi:hypothetical protein
LECVPKYASRMLFDTNRSSPLLNALLEGESMYEASLASPPNGLVVARLLLPILNMQIEQCMF